MEIVSEGNVIPDLNDWNNKLNDDEDISLNTSAFLQLRWDCKREFG
jgi:hypothetical protein